MHKPKQGTLAIKNGLFMNCAEVVEYLNKIDWSAVSNSRKRHEHTKAAEEHTTYGYRLHPFVYRHIC